LNIEEEKNLISTSEKKSLVFSCISFACIGGVSFLFNPNIWLSILIFNLCTQVALWFICATKVEEITEVEKGLNIYIVIIFLFVSTNVGGLMLLLKFNPFVAALAFGTNLFVNISLWFIFHYKNPKPDEAIMGFIILAGIAGSLFVSFAIDGSCIVCSINYPKVVLSSLTFGIILFLLHGIDALHNG